MSELDRMIENVNATMSMEGMPLEQEDRIRLRACLDGEVSFDEAIKSILEKYNNK